jgi:integrase
MGVTVREKVPGSDVWWIYINHKGKRASKKVGSKRAAKETAVKIEKEIALERFNLQAAQVERVPTFEEYAEKWLSGYVEANLKPATCCSYKSGLKIHLLPVFGAMPINEITREAVKEFLYEKKATGLSARSVELIGVTLGVIFNHAKEDGIVMVNPAEKIGKVIKVEKGKRHVADFLTVEELGLFLRTARKHYPRFYPAFALAALTGMRRGEVAALQWDDIDWHGKFIVVQRNEWLGRILSPKNGKTRRVDASDQLLAILQEHRRSMAAESLRLGRPMSEYMFENEAKKDEDRGGFSSGYLWEVFKKILKKAGMRSVRLHDLRHSYASALIANGESLAYVRDQLGHADISMTVNKYGHLVPGANRDAVNRLGDQIGLGITGVSAPPAHPAVDGSTQVAVSE